MRALVVAGLCLLSRGPLWAAEPARGDLPPRVTELAQLLDAPLGSADAHTLFEAVRKALLQRSGSDIVTEADLYLGAVQGMIDAVNARQRASGGGVAWLPPPGMLIREADARELQQHLHGFLTGIGLDFQLVADPGFLLIGSVLPGSPGEAAGLRRGDRIVEIGGVPIGGLDLDAVLGLLQPRDDGGFAMRVVRDDAAQAAVFRVTVRRATFPVADIETALAEEGVGIIRFARLHSDTASRVAAALTELRARGADRFVLDMRSCGGGDLRGAVDVGALFVPKGAVVMRTIEPGVGDRDWTAAPGSVATEDLAILVDRYTAGVAEALAGGLQEHGRAVIIGETTAGSGRTETLVPVGYGFTLRLDSVRLESPSGRTFAGHGVRPDQAVSSVLGSETRGGLDPEIVTAVHYLVSAGGRR